MNRSFAVIGALVAYFLARALKVDIPGVVLDSVVHTPSGLALFLLAFVMPALAGVVATVAIVKAMSAGGEVATRIALFEMTLVLLVFMDVYVSAYTGAGGLDRQLAPNGAFVLGVAMVFVLTPASAAAASADVRRRSPHLL
jgi:hypothetical protein